ncbi:BTAD domain-containing putative transcriptional regulator [Streptomyces sp. NPDC059002]|uniref:AfsR/SARP family transcriptional regulator n=1 Tax=Streptomyces sp. NPDC059002 TaxID=3346690 RepID=UPI0036B930B2
MRGDAEGDPVLNRETEADRSCPSGSLTFQVLGPVRAWRDGRQLALGSPQQRAILAVLLLHHGRPVSVAELVDALWGEEPPPRAVGTLRTYVSRLRALLEPDRRARGRASLLVSAGGGYALRVPRDALDASALEDRLTAARRLRGADQYAGAYGELTAALALTNGTPLAGLPGPYAERQRDRLTELSVTAQEELFACALELGRHAEATPPLRAFAAEHPLRERAQALLMLALRRGGRQADALAVYETTRRTLATELGVDPGNELAALHEGLLNGDAETGTARQVPAQRATPLRRVPEAGGRDQGQAAARDRGRDDGRDIRGRTLAPGGEYGQARHGGQAAIHDLDQNGIGTDARAVRQAQAPATGIAVRRPMCAEAPEDPEATLTLRSAAPPPDGTAPHPRPGRTTAARPHTLLTAPPAGTAVPTRHSPVPAQLPPDVPDFAGRQVEAAVLTETLHTAVDGSTMALAALTGLGGVGKTALAVHVAHALRGEFPDGQLYVDLGAPDPTRDGSSASALVGFLRALGVPESAVPDGLDQQTALYRSLLAGRRVLVLLDNARDTAQVRPLLPGAPGCAVLVTSRSRTIALPGVRLVDVDVMDEAQALGLLAAIVGRDRVTAEPAAAGELVAACGGLPLAVRIAAARLAARPGRSVADLAARLRDERRRLDELRVADLGVEATFRLGYEALAPELARAFRVLSLCYMPSFCRGAAGALLDVRDEEAESIVERLVDAGLMELHDDDRYRFHDLVRLFAARQCERHESPAERAAARLRFLDYVLATVITAIRRTKPHSVLPELLHRPASDGKPLPDAAAAHDWLVVAHSRLYAAAENALRHLPAAGDGTATDGAPPGLRPTVDLLTAWSHLLVGTARHRDLEPLAELALETARRHGDDLSAGRALRLIGTPHYGTETYARAERVLRESLRLAASAGDPLVGAESSHELGIVLMGMGRAEEALEQLQQAYVRFGALDGRSDRIRVLSHLVRAYSALGRSAEADAARSEALSRARESGSTATLAHALYQVGCALLGDGRTAEAADRLREAQRLHRWSRSPRWEALCWARLAYCELAEERPTEALACADEALTIEGELGDVFCRALATAARGRALLARGDLDGARSALRSAQRVMERRGAVEATEIAALLAELESTGGQVLKGSAHCP